jgi:protoheme IX farnesyltransferase
MTTAPPNFQPNVSTAAAARAVSGVRGTFGALGELVKPSIAGLVMVTATCGALVSPEPIRWGKLLVALVSTAMVVGAANALNMYAERDSDALMSRTRHRPLPSGRLSPEIALAFALVLASLGLNVLGLSSGGLPCLLTALAFGSYVLVYTPLKRVTPYALHVGALPGAIPPLIGYAAVSGELGAAAWWLFAILFVWQLPHFLAIALFRSADYARAGAAVLPVVRGELAGKRAVVHYSLLLVLVTVLPAPLGVVESEYLLVAIPIGVAFLALVFGGRSRGTDRWAKRVFFASMPYLVCVYAAFVAAAR